MEDCEFSRIMIEYKTYQGVMTEKRMKQGCILQMLKDTVFWNSVYTKKIFSEKLKWGD